jgi:GT2 family glycosyltransferase
MIRNAGRCCGYLLNSDVRPDKDMVERNLDELEKFVG